MHYFTALVITEPENIGFFSAFTTSVCLAFFPSKKVSRRLCQEIFFQEVVLVKVLTTGSKTALRYYHHVLQHNTEQHTRLVTYFNIMPQ